MTPSTPSNSGPVVGRFAPSPTGPLHIGSLVAALGSYILAKQAGGRWLVRMEDLDRPRVVPGSADDQLRTLEALGFSWDGPTVWQSQRTAAYQAAFDQLLAKGDIYPCGCSRAAIARTASAPHDGEGEVVYPGTCRTGLAAGTMPRAYRVRVADQSLQFFDQIQGDQAYNLAHVCGDFVIKRADGLFAYQLAVVVDDAAQGVTQVVRGADLLSSTPRQMLLQQLLGFSTPEYAHLPLVVDAGGGKLSKRNTTVSLGQEAALAHNGWQLLAAAASCLGCQISDDMAGAPCRLLLDWLVANLDPSSIPVGPVASPLHNSL
jgi:glutamyl-Q tRNA(Asp) synthetase